MNPRQIPSRIPSLATVLGLGTLLLASGCGGGGGSGGAFDSDTGGRAYVLTAPVTRDSCGDRLSAVQQQRFVLEQNGDGISINTSLVAFDLAENEGSYVGGFSETNGDCTRNYSVVWSDLNSDNPDVTLLSRSTCGANVCETEWKGQAAPATSPRESANDRVRGENCNSAVPPTVGYRPSLFECNGNAAVLLGGNIRNNYSVVVRRDGQFNDRDPRNPSCGTNRCSPYKTQKRLELAPYQVNCLGDNGYSADYAPVKRISIKFVANVTNANDTRQFEQYCLNNTQASSN